METEESLGFVQLLESSALELKNKGVFSTELAPKDLEHIMRSVIAQSEVEMKKQGVSAQINRLGVQISGGKGEVDTSVTASKRVGFMNPSVGIEARFGMENVLGSDSQPTGRLRTTRLEVTPETLFMVVKPKDFLAPYLEGEKINNTFRNVLDTEMQMRGTRISEMKLAFTPENKFRIELQGNKR